MQELIDIITDLAVGSGLLAFATYLVLFNDLMLGGCLGIVGACILFRSLRVLNK